ncbi:unnamed protein product, partial [Porites lobata]
VSLIVLQGSNHTDLDLRQAQLTTFTRTIKLNLHYDDDDDYYYTLSGDTCLSIPFMGEPARRTCFQYPIGKQEFAIFDTGPS